MKNQPFAGIAHYLTDFLPVNRFIAMGFTVLAGRFGILRTSLQPFE